MHTIDSCVVYRSGALSSHRVGDASDKTTRLHETGFDSAESHLAVASNGTMFFAPAFTEHGATVLRSRDDGLTWQSCPIDDFEGRHHGRPQPNLYLDRHTERLFFYTAAVGVFPPRRGFHLSWSDDQGESWSHRTVGKAGLDWGKLLAGPSTVEGRGRVLYFSVPAPISTRFFPVLFPKYQQIYRSYDNGVTFEACGKMSLRALDHGLDRREWVIFGSGVVADDGTVLIGLRRGPRLAVAISRDDGSTWQVDDIPGSTLLRYRNILQVGIINPNYVIGEPLAFDSRGNLFALWPDSDDRLRLAWSSDQGATWSRPTVVSAPDVKRVRYCSLTAGPDGSLALAYYGTPDGTTYRGYIAESLDPTAEFPVFAGGVVDPAARPLYPRGWDTGYIDMLAGGDLNEVLQVRYAPSGALFASFCRQERSGWPKRVRPRAHLVGVVGELS